MPLPRTPFDRTTGLARLRDGTFDVVVVGGGVTGCGVAVDAAARGLRTALVERDDWAAGTSSKSSKLVHGGLRYLQQREFALVYENLAERQRLLDNGGPLVHVLPFLIPVFGRDGVANKAYAKAISSALWMYDLTGGLRIGRRHERISKAQALAHLPTLDTERLVDAFLYYDAQADDARLTLALARTAVLEGGAVAVNHAAVVGIDKGPDGRVTGVRLAGEGCDGLVVRTGCVVNAGGVWADDVRALDEPTHPDSIRPAKGIHLTVPGAALPCDIAAVVTVPQDKRSIFVVPWGDFTYLGTTDTDYSGPIDDPQCTPADVAYVLDAVNAWVSKPISVDDVVGTWAGLRPLVKGEAVSERTADLSRRHRVAMSASGVVSITGGKLTTYRKMAADTVDEVVRLAGRGARRSPTKRLRLHGVAGADTLAGAEAASRLGLDPAILAHLVSRYGTEARTVAAMVSATPAWADPLVPGLPYLRAEAVYAVRYEMARTLEDVLARRTRALLLERDASAAAAPAVAALLAPELGWSAAQEAAEVERYRAAVERERVAAGLPVTDALAGLGAAGAGEPAASAAGS